MRASLLRNLIDQPIVPAGKHRLMARLHGESDDGGTDPLAAARDEKAFRLHVIAHYRLQDQLRIAEYLYRRSTNATEVVVGWLVPCNGIQLWT